MLTSVAPGTSGVDATATSPGLSDAAPEDPAMPPSIAPFHSPAPTVTLLREESTQHPFALAIAAAWSCYGARPARVENVVKLVHGPAPEGLSPAKAAERA